MVNIDGKDVEYSVKFEVTGTELSLDVLNILMEGTVTSKMNFVRLEENGNGRSCFMDAVGSNTGVFYMDDINSSKSTVAHEYGHSLGWFDASQTAGKNPNNPYMNANSEYMHDYVGGIENGKRIPGIMSARNMPYWAMTGSNDNCNNVDVKVNKSYFDKKGRLDPDKRKVLQSDVSNVMKGYTPASTSIGKTTNYKHKANGGITYDRVLRN